MLIARSLEDIPPLLPPCGLTIGNFDGMHPGHQYLFETLRRTIGEAGKLVVLTFNNHPADVLPGRARTPLLCSLSYKLKLIERAGADLVIALDFTKECAETPYDVFLHGLKQQLPFSHLVLGKGASFGKNRAGNEENVSKLAQELNFQVSYLEKQSADGEPISSGLIRASLEQGDLKKVNSLLGRPYTLYGKVKNGVLETQDLCLPPPGFYPLLIRTERSQFPAAARITDKVHIECEENLLECIIEAIFL